ncbi:MAG: AsmA family protein [Rhodospirillales bacterium]|nr:AsmA family protein [Rhodospirillales bacterium]
MLKWSGILILALVGVVGGVFYLLASSLNGEEVRILIDREVGAATGRHLSIEGDISVRPSLFPVVELEGVSFSNADWSETAVMLRADHLFAQLSLLQLLMGSFVLEEISIDGAELLLETDAEGRNNWDFAAATSAGGNRDLLTPSVTTLDQINDVLASLLSITSYVDEFYINDLSVQYVNVGVETARVYDIDWVGMEAADQDQRIVVDISAGASRRNQSLHLEVYGGKKFLDRQEDMGLAIAIDAEKWKGQLTGALVPQQNVTAVDLEIVLDVTDGESFYHDLGWATVLPEWSGTIEPISLDFRALIQGPLRHPSLDRVKLKVHGKQESWARFNGQISDVLNEADVAGQLSAQIGTPSRYGVLFLNDPAFWSEVEDVDLGPLTLTGEVGGRLLNPSIQNATLEWGKKEDIRATITGRVTDLFGLIAPVLVVNVKAGSDLLIHRFATALAPDGWPGEPLPLAPVEGNATLVRGETGELGLNITALDLGDTDIARISLTSIIPNLHDLDKAEVDLEATVKDSPRLRGILKGFVPGNIYLSRMPPLGEINFSGTIQRRGQKVVIPSFNAQTGGSLPMTVSVRGEGFFASMSGMDGAIVFKGPDMYALVDAVSNLLASESIGPDQFDQTFLPSTKGFQVEGRVVAGEDTLTVSGFSATFSDSHLLAELHIKDDSGRPQVTLAVTDASLYLPEISDLLMLADNEPVPETELKSRIFQADDFSIPILADFDMVATVAGEVIGFDSPILDSLNMDMVLERGTLHLRRGLGATTKGNFSLSGNWNIAGEGEPTAVLALDINDISLGSLLHRTEVADWLRGAPMSGSVKGRLKGLSPADLAASFTGQVDLSVGPGEIDKSVIDWLGGDLISSIYSALNPFAETIPYSQLLCAEARLPFVEGIADFERKIALETKRVALMASGQIDLGQERIELSLASTPKEGFGPSLGGGALVGLAGSLDDPKIVLDTWGVSKKAISVGTSILTGGISSLLETIFDRLTKESNLCQSVAGVSTLQ